MSNSKWKDTFWELQANWSPRRLAPVWTSTQSTWQRLSVISFTFANWFRVILKSFCIIYLWLCWAFPAVHRLSPAVAVRDHSLVPQLLLLRSTGSTVVARGLSCSAACGIFLDQGSISCIGRRILYHWATREVLILSEVEYIFMFLLVTFMSSLEKYLFRFSICF